MKNRIVWMLVFLLFCLDIIFLSNQIMFLFLVFVSSAVIWLLSPKHNLAKGISQIEILDWLMIIFGVGTLFYFQFNTISFLIGSNFLLYFIACVMLFRWLPSRIKAYLNSQDR